MYVGLASTLHFVSSVSLGGILAPIIECHARGISVWNGADSYPQTLQHNIGGPRTACEKVSPKVHFLALSAFEGVLSLRNRWNDLLSCRGPDFRIACGYKVEHSEQGPGQQHQTDGFNKMVCSFLVFRC